MSTKRTLAVALATLLVTGGLATVASALPVSNRNATTDAALDGEDARLDRLLSALQERYDLTDQQVAELEATIVELRADGASRSEIARAIGKQLVEFGVDEDRLRRDYRSLQAGQRLVEAGLSPAEARDMVGDARRLHAEGAPREEVREHVRDRVSHTRHDGPHLAWYAEYLGLTDEQVEELQTVAQEARADGAYPAEVRTAVIEQLYEYGYTSDDLERARWAHRLKHLQIRFDLTDEQVALLEEDVDHLVEADALGVEIRAAVLENLKAFGVVPEDATDRPRGPAPEPPADT